MRVLNSSQMREADRRTVDDIGISSLVLMENAGRQAVAAMEAMHSDLLERQVAVLCGRSWWLGEPLAIPLHRLENGALLIFAFFMVSDPKTTPAGLTTRTYSACPSLITAREETIRALYGLPSTSRTVADRPGRKTPPVFGRVTC